MICRDSNNFNFASVPNNWYSTRSVLTTYQAEVAHAKQQLHSVYTKLEECERSVENGREEVEQVSYLLNCICYIKNYLI